MRSLDSNINVIRLDSCDRASEQWQVSIVVFFNKTLSLDFIFVFIFVFAYFDYCSMSCLHLSLALKRAK